MIILHEMVIIAGIFSEKTNKSIIYGALCRNVTIFYRQKLPFSFHLQENLKVCRSLKLNFLSNGFLADDIHVKIEWLHVAAFSEHDILHF